LKGIDIPIDGRIAAISDIYDALTSKRPYKEPYPIKKALEIMQSQRGQHFDPDLLDRFFDHAATFIKIKKELSCEKDTAREDFELSERDQNQG
jgi:putative two-component system response regulator